MLADAQHIPGRERCGAERREHVRGTRPEHRRNVDPTAHGQVGSHARDRQTDSEGRAGRGVHCPVGVDGLAIEGEGRRSTGHGEPGRLLEPRRKAAEQDLHASASFVVAEQAVAEAKGCAVERSGRAHADVGSTGASEVLDQGERTGLLDAHAHNASTNRTAVPGASRAGRSAAGSQSTASVDPISCQPPGLDRG